MNIKNVILTSTVAALAVFPGLGCTLDATEPVAEVAAAMKCGEKLPCQDAGVAPDLTGEWQLEWERDPNDGHFVVLSGTSSNTVEGTIVIDGAALGFSEPSGLGFEADVALAAAASGALAGTLSIPALDLRNLRVTGSYNVHDPGITILELTWEVPAVDTDSGFYDKQNQAAGTRFSATLTRDDWE